MRRPAPYPADYEGSDWGFPWFLVVVWTVWLVFTGVGIVLGW